MTITLLIKVFIIYLTILFILLVFKRVHSNNMVSETIADIFQYRIYKQVIEKKEPVVDFVHIVVPKIFDLSDWGQYILSDEQKIEVYKTLIKAGGYKGDL